MYVDWVIVNQIAMATICIQYSGTVTAVTIIWTQSEVIYMSNLTVRQLGNLCKACRNGEMLSKGHL